jgi:sulfur relay (sulfurtransferase) complex TusBCD TusD component (DsrE family)
MQRFLLILNDPPLGTEHSDDAPRLACRLVDDGDSDRVPDALRGSLVILTEWTQRADKVLVF